jgi:hypothetical protein
MSDDTIDDGEKVQWGIGGADRGRHKAAIEAWVAVFERAWVEQPWRHNRELVCDSGRDLSFDEMVLFLADLMNTHPLVGPASDALGSSPDGALASQCPSEVTRG